MKTSIIRIARRVNIPLTIGIILLTILLLASLFPDKFTELDPTYRQAFRFERIIEDGQASHRIVSPPWGPIKENIMGTDEFGRDIYSRLVYGTRITLTTALMVVLLRLLLAIPLGIMAGIGNKVVSSFIRFWNTVFTSIPIVFVAFVIFNIQFMASLHIDTSIMAFAIILTILGWGKLARQIEETTNKIMKEEFIEGEVAVGKNKFQIALQNMLPHLVPSLISISFIEVGLVIFLLAQLSVLEVFVGPRGFFQRVDDSFLAVSINPEWASMLSRAAVNNRLGYYWVSLYPALAFSVGILAFNLTGEGLRIEFDKRTSRVTSFIRRLGFVFSPRIYFQQIIRFKEYYKAVTIKTAVILLLIIVLAIPAPNSLYSFEVDMAMEHVNELLKPEYEGRLTGFNGNYLAGDYIVEKLKEYGLEPYEDDNYIQTYPIHRSNPRGPAFFYGIVDYGKITLTADNGEVTDYHIHDDFLVASFKGRDRNPENLDGNFQLSLKDISYNIVDGNDRSGESGVFYSLVLIPYRMEFFNKLLEEDKRVDVGFIFYDKEEDIPIMPTFIGQQHNIIPKGELAEKLKKGDYKVDISLELPREPQEARNIFAVLPGRDWDQPDDSNHKKEVIIIGASYDGLGMLDDRNSAISTSRAAINLEIARVLSEIDEPLDKTIVFAFWDGVFSGRPGPFFYDQYGRIYRQQSNQIYYFDVGFVGREGQINVNVETPILGQVETYDLTNSISKRLKQTKVDHVFRGENSTSSFYMGQNLSLKVSANTVKEGNLHTISDTVENIDKNQMKNIGQFFIDLITMEPFFN